MAILKWFIIQKVKSYVVGKQLLRNQGKDIQKFPIKILKEIPNDYVN